MITKTLTNASRTYLGMSALLLAVASAHAGTYEIDTGFGNAGRYNQTFDGSDFRTLAHLIKPDGTSVAVTTYDNNGCPAGRSCFGLYLFNAAGVFQSAITVPNSLSFSKRNPAGLGVSPILVKDAAIDSQGRILIAGTEQFGTVFQFKVIRLLPNGQADTTFDGDGIVTPGNFTAQNEDFANAIAVDSSDRVLLAGSAKFSDTDRDFAVLRLTSTGALDTSFDGDGRKLIAFDLGGAAVDFVNAMDIRPGGQIYLAGVARDSARGNINRIALAKLLPSGAFDTQFCATTCTEQGPYTAINSGRRVLFYGQAGDNLSDTVESLTVNFSGEMVYSGLHQTTSNAFVPYVQKVALNGDYANEALADNLGLTGTLVYSVGGIRYLNKNSATSDLVLTGSVGPGLNFFFAQGLDSVLAPKAGWGLSGANNSAILYAASGGFGDNSGDSPAIPSTDAATGRIFVGGSYKAVAGATNFSVNVMRLKPTAAITEAIFRNGFE
jgi:uncharacterized delta-60 repeat protein